MSNKKKTSIIILAGAVALASIILVITILVPKIREKALESELEALAVDYYEKDFKTKLPDFLKTYKNLPIDLETLKKSGRDISKYEEKNCDTAKTYVQFVLDGESYTTEVHMNCED